MGRDCLKVLKSVNLSSTESQDSKACLQALENHFKPAKPPLSFIREIKVNSTTCENVSFSKRKDKQRYIKR